MSDSSLIVDSGKPCMGIHCPVEHPGGMAYAQDELRRFIALQTGCTLPDGQVDGQAILLEVDPNLNKVHKEAYRISSDNRGIRIAGATPPAVVFAVMDFLETQVGIGFAGLGEEGVRIAYDPTLAVVVKDRLCKPDLSYRAMQLGLHEDMADWMGLLSTLHIARLDWIVQHRMNYVVLDPPIWNYSKLEYSTDGDGWHQMETLLPELHKRGIKVQWCHHCWNRWLPVSKYFATHPEYYAMVDGKRVTRQVQLSLCTSNPEVAHVMADEMIAIVEQHPEVDVLSIWPEDGLGRCECSKCEALSDLPSGPQHMKVPGTEDDIFISSHDLKKTYIYTEFINRVAQIVAQSKPDVKLSALYYCDIDAPPKNIELEPNVIPHVSLYWRCSRHALDHPNCENVYYNRILEQWAQKYSGRIVIEDKPMGMTAYAGLPWPIVPQWHKDWKRFKAMGIIGGSMQAQAAHTTVYGPNYAMFARMAWDIDRPTKDLHDPYFRNLYGQASDPILAMQSAIEDRFFHHDRDLDERIAVDENLLHGHPSFRKYYSDCIYPLPDTIARIFDQSTFEKIYQHLDLADGLAKDDRVRLNLKKIRAASDYWLLVYRFQMTLAKARRASGETENTTNKNHMPELIDQCIQDCRDIVDFVDTMPYRDVLARCMALNWCWIRQARQLVRWKKDPAGNIPVGIRKWP